MVSIIIRTKNEGRWIRHCLEAINSQTFKALEVIIVDNCSSDNTLELVKNHDLYLKKKVKIVTISEYIPGKALNIGIRNSVGSYIVCISAHCIPGDNNWLHELVLPIIKGDYVASYGRQVPMPYSSPSDIRDLALVFQKDSREQINDYFFHNAHSVFTRKIWEKFPFDETLSNIEDRIFGKALVENGYVIFYNAIPYVYHFHGIHQAGNKKRLSGVVRIMKSLDDNLDLLPEVCSIENTNNLLFVPVKEKLMDLSKDQIQEIIRSLNQLNKIPQIQRLCIIAYSDLLNHIRSSLENDFILFDREEVTNHQDIGVFDLIQGVLKRSDEIISGYDVGVYYSLKYGVDSESIRNLQFRLKTFPRTGVDIYFPAKKDYGYYWYFENEYDPPVSFEKKLELGHRRRPLFQAFYGLGSVFHISELLTGNLLEKSLLIDSIE